MTLLLEELKAALEPYGTRVSLLVTEELLLEGKNDVSGVDLSVLLPLVDGVYAQGVTPETGQALVNVLAEGAETVPVFVPMTAEPGEGHWCQVN